MELSWFTKTKITLAALVGVLIIGFMGYPLAAAPDYQYIITLPTLPNSLILMGLAIICGFIAYFVSWPYGREVGLVAVPAGLSIWAIRSGSLFDYTQFNPALAQRIDIYSTLRWQSVFWLIIVLFGFLGVLIAQRIKRPKEIFPQVVTKYYFSHTFSQFLFALNIPVISKILGLFGYEKIANVPTENKSSFKNYIANIALAFVASVLIAFVGLRIFAQSMTAFSSKSEAVFAQASSGQILFGTMVSFGLAAFLVKQFLNASFIWPVLASILVIPLLNVMSLKRGVLEYFAGNWPAAFFPHPAAYILPIQMIAFGTLGSIIGFWLVVRFRVWRELES
jgi:hypothetical protein